MSKCTISFQDTHWWHARTLAVVHAAITGDFASIEPEDWWTMFHHLTDAINDAFDNREQHAEAIEALKTFLVTVTDYSVFYAEDSHYIEKRNA